MLAVVSMALASCGGGDEGVKPADPAVTYETVTGKDKDKEYRVELRDCLQVKKVSIRGNGIYKVSVTAQIEMVKEPSEPIQWIRAGVEVLDKNEAQICKYTTFGGMVLEGVVHKGDVGSLSCEIDTDILASEVIEDAKFIRVVSAWGRNLKD